MSESIESIVRDKVKQKEVSHYLVLVQKIKGYIDTVLLDLSSKNEEERIKGYFSALTKIRDLTQVELNEYAFSQNINLLIDNHLKKIEIEKKDLETFNDLTSENSEKVKTRKAVGERPINYHKMRAEIESTTND